MPKEIVKEVIAKEIIEKPKGEYSIIKKNGKFYEQTEKEADVNGMKAKLEDLKNRKRIAIEQVSKIYDPRIEALETSLNNINNA